MTPGQYVFAPEDTPFYPGEHWYGSRNWISKEMGKGKHLGELPYSYHEWHDGLAPLVFPNALLLGTDECVRDGEQLESAGDWGTVESNATIIASGTAISITLPEYFGPVSQVQSAEASREYVFKRSRRVRWSFDAALSFADANSNIDIRVSLDDRTVGTYVVNASELLPSLKLQARGTFEIDVGTHVVAVSAIRMGTVSLSNVTASLLLEFDPVFAYEESAYREGFQLQCYLPPLPITNPPAWPQLEHYLPDIGLRRDQRELARILNLMYISEADANLAALELLGPGTTLVSVPNTAALIPGSIITSGPKGFVVFLSGTTTFQQLAIQATTSLAGPVNMGAFATLAFWFSSANAILTRMSAAGVTPDLPLLVVAHSYGACIAAIIAGRIVPAARVDLLTFGMPCPGDDRLATLIATRRNLHVANRGDPVPSLPPRFLSLQYVGSLLPLGVFDLWKLWAKPRNQVILERDGTTFDSQEDTYRITDLVALVAVIVGGGTPALAADHDMQEYLNRLLV